MISKILVAMDGLKQRCNAALLIVNIFDAFKRISGKIKQELGDVAKQIEAEGGTAITLQMLDDYKSQAKDSNKRCKNTKT
jgi:hypothetical protein